MKKIFVFFLLAGIWVVAATQVFAAGFQLNSQSAAGIGRAFAGDAVIADNASVLSRNPAAMAMFDSKSMSIGLAYADLDVEVTNVTNQLGGYIGSDYDVSEDKIIPHGYYIHPLSDQWSFGVAAFSNFGTGTDLSEMALNSGVPLTPYDLLGKTELTTMDLNISAAYRINPEFSIGLGLDIIYGSGEITRNMGNTKLVNVDADGFGLGAVAGATYEFNGQHRLGMSYRYSPSVSADGTANIWTPGGIVSYDEIEVPVPDIFQFAGYHRLVNWFALSYTAQWTEWSTFDSIDLKGSPSGDAVLKEYQWKNSWLYSVGATFYLNDQWTLRAGYMRDNAVTDQLQSISIPDTDRDWYTGGLTYAFSPKSSIDFGIALVRGNRTQVTENSSLPMVGAVTADTYSNATYYSVSYNYSF